MEALVQLWPANGADIPSAILNWRFSGTIDDVLREICVSNWLALSAADGLIDEVYVGISTIVGCYTGGQATGPHKN